MKKIRWLAALWALCLLSGCTMASEHEKNTEDAVHDELPLVTEVSGTIIGEPLEEDAQALLENYMNSWYRSSGSFEVEDLSELFRDSEDARRHESLLRSIVAVRAEAPEDLHMERCRWQLNITAVENKKGLLCVEALEDTTVRFVGIDVDSEMFDTAHSFTLVKQDDVWKLAEHESRYGDFAYDEATNMDKKIEMRLGYIKARRTQWGTGNIALPDCDHPYDREAALSYMKTYADHRNPEWAAYDDDGGNCMNFTSQVLLAGGIPMKYENDALDGWHWEALDNRSVSFIDVEEFYDFAATNRGAGLVAVVDAPYYSGQVGDVILMGNEGLEHATQICDLVKDEQGNTIDYLLCSNTTNYRNFPASAYYFTWQTLIRICGWND